jgi:hypothetical protein
MNGAIGMSDIEHARLADERVDGYAARVAGVRVGNANDQGKAARVAASECGQQVSFKPQRRALKFTRRGGPAVAHLFLVRSKTSARPDTATLAHPRQIL